MRGYDAGRKVKGRKWHIIVDTLGNLLEVVVHAAKIQDRDGVGLLLKRPGEESNTKLAQLWADGAYSERLVEWVRGKPDTLLEMVPHQPQQKGFQILARRWVVERTKGWFNRYRRLSKDCERLIESSERMVYLASIQTMLKRLAPYS